MGWRSTKNHHPRIKPALRGRRESTVPQLKPETNLSFPGNGLVKEKVAGLRLVDAIVRGRGAAEGLEAVGGQRRRRRGRVGLVAGGAPAPVAAAARAGRHAASLLPRSAQALCPFTQAQRQYPVPDPGEPRHG